MNYLIFILDSCRYDVFISTFFDIFSKDYNVQKVIAHANWTLPALTAMLHGYMPDILYDYSNEVVPMKRWWLQKFNITRSNVRPVPYWLQSECKKRNIEINIHSNFKWSKTLNSLANVYFYDVDYLVNIPLTSIIRNYVTKSNYITFLHCAHTHYPYLIPNMERFRVIDNKVAHKVTKDMQEEACYRCLSQIYKNLQLVSNVHVVITADHGECFGEDNNWGHYGCWHKHVLEIPFVEFEI